MRQIKNIMTSLFLCNLATGCEALPEGPVTPDGYRPPELTQENIENMARNAIKNMVFIQGGSYMMGNIVCFTDKKNELVKKYQIQHIVCRGNEAPVHMVTLDSFYLSKYEIQYFDYDLFTQATNREWIQVRYLTPKWWRSRDSKIEAVIERFSGVRAGDYPAAIDWFEARDYCRWLGKITGLPIDLPTEAQWEYAGRNRGQNVPYATDNGRQDIGRNYPNNDDRDRYPVTSYPPNPLGLHHMTGNVSEWVLDWFDENFYKYSTTLNPLGPTTGTKKILRGGSGGSTPYYNHNFKRVGEYIDYTHEEDWYKDPSVALNKGDASSMHGARCAIHFSEPIDTDNLNIDLSKPAPDSRAEWLSTKESRTAKAEERN